MSSSLANMDHNLPSRNRFRQQRGLSVLDLLLAVALIGALCALAIPAVAKTLQLHRLDTSASIVASKLSEARMNAIKRNRQVWLAINPANRTIRLQTTNDAGATINLGAAQTLSEGVSFASPSAVTQVRFDSLGRLPSGTSSWTLILQGAQNTERKNVTISVAGTINVGNMNSYSQQESSPSTQPGLELHPQDILEVR